MSTYRETIPPARGASWLTSLVGPVLLLSAIGFVFLLAAGSNLAAAIIAMLPA